MPIGKVWLICSHCGREFQKYPSQTHRSQYGLHFCSRNCLNDYRKNQTNPFQKPGPKSEPLVIRFWKRVVKTEHGCWLFQGRLDKGYGHIKENGLIRLAHRYSWELHNGEIPDGLLVCHKCDIRNCVNPAHLFLGTHQDNNDDMWQKGRGKGEHAGETHHSAKLRNSQIPQIRRLHSEGNSYKDIALVAGVSAGSIGKIIRGERWKSIL